MYYISSRPSLYKYTCAPSQSYPVASLFSILLCKTGPRSFFCDRVIALPFGKTARATTAAPIATYRVLILFRSMLDSFH